MKDIIDLIGRIFISIIFLYQGVTSILEASAAKEVMINHGINNQTQLLFLTGIGLMLIGGISVLVGYRAKLGAFLLLIFLIPSTLTYYFDFDDVMKQQMLLRNVAIMGGLLLLMANGSGKYSVKRLLAGIR